MSEKCISSIHVQKLGHKIQEIRERALHNIISKLDHGFVYDNDLARSKEILSKLFDWFLFEPFTKEDIVLNLIQRILKTECGIILMKHYGTNVIKTHLKDIRSRIDTVHVPLIDDILKYVDAAVINEVPPLTSDLPLSHRTDNTTPTASSNVGTTATSIRGQFHESESVEQEAGPTYIPKPDTPQEFRKSVPNFLLPWLPLIPSDRHVLDSVEDSLRNPPQPASLLHSCEFFIDVMLHDFPAEIFLQRPGIILIIQKLASTHESIRIKTASLNCLLNLTNALHTRINFHCDPLTYNLKESDYSQINTDYCTNVKSKNVHESAYFDTYRSKVSNPGGQTEENFEDTALLQTKQLSLPHHCVNTFNCIFHFLSVKYENLNEIKRKKSQVALNSCLLLLDRNISLLSLCVTEELWNYKRDKIISDFIHQFTNVLSKFGEILEFYRLEVISNDSDRTLRCTHLHIIYSCVNLLSHFVPLNMADFILPRNMKSALVNILLDCSFAKLYINAHGSLVNYIQSFNGNYQNDSLKKYNDIKDICDSITAAIKFIKNGKGMNINESVPLARIGLLSLEFHQHKSFMRVFIEICTNILPMSHIPDDIQTSIDYIILSLLSYNDLNIKEDMYNLCHKRIIAAIGPKLNSSRTSVPGSQILFLLRSEIIIEIATFGLTSENKKIAKYSEDMLIHILKCKILVNETVWNKVVEAIIPAIPILLCYAGKNDSLGRTLLSILDPDKASDLYIASIAVLKGNACLLFTDDNLARTEAISRLCWLLASQYHAKTLLPKISNLQDKALTSVCILKRTSDLNKTRGQQHFYSPSGLTQVLEMLNSNGVEPVIRRSAITQVSVMMEDPSLHITFMEHGGVDTVLNVIKSALIENNYNDYPDSVIPAICVLKNVCLHCPSLRQELANDVDILYYVLRSLFMYCTEGRMKQDGSTLLFLLLYTNFIHGTPSRGDMSLPHIVFDKLYVPFTCNVHWKCSKYYIPSLTAVILSDKWCLTSIQIHWNSEWYGGFQQLLIWDEPTYNEGVEFNDKLKINSNALIGLKNSCIELNIKTTLQEVQNGTNHINIHNGINKLIMFLYLYEKISNIESHDIDILSYDWETTFIRFLITPSASEEDTLLLINVFKCLSILAKLYKYTENDCWITSFLIIPSYCLSALLQMDHATEEDILLHQELLSLITTCAFKEQHYSTFSVVTDQKSSAVLWTHVITALTETLQLNDSQHFYNIAYLDCSLRCLVQLTSSLGWSNSKEDMPPKPFMKQLITELCQLLEAFHCGKGQSSTSSYMGLSITRNVMLILNHILTELQHSNVKMHIWEEYFLENNIGDKNVISLWSLWKSRDVILRASVVQLFSGLVISDICTNELLKEVGDETKGILEYCFDIILDHSEASIVREKASNLLTNILSNLSEDVAKYSTQFLKPYSNKTFIQKIIKIMARYNFFKEVEIILLTLYTKNKFYADNNNDKRQVNSSFPSDDSIVLNFTRMNSNHDNVRSTHRSTITDIGNIQSNGESCYKMVTTPAFIRGICNLVHNLVLLSPEIVTANLNENGLVKIFFRCICDICIEIRSTKDLMLYSDLLEMNASICFLLTKVITQNSNCLISILHTKDYLHNTIALLNPNLYYLMLPQLIYLRNKLWCEIFSLISVLLEANMMSSAQLEAINTLSVTLKECGYEPFLQTLCESIDSNCSNDLQISALSSLTSLLRWETSSNVDNQPNNKCDHSMQILLDTVQTPPLTHRKVSESSRSKSDTKSLKFNVLEDIYFNPCKKIMTRDEEQFGSKSTMIGAEFCKILLELYDIVHLNGDNRTNAKKKYIIINTLTSVLCISQEAKRYALENGLLNMITKQLKEIHIKLSLETPDCMRRVSGKKKLSPLLKDLSCLIGLISNFIVGDLTVKNAFASSGVSDIIHKLWVWFLNQRHVLINALKFLCSFTTNCPAASQSLTLTSSVAGSGPRKIPSNVSLLHAIFLLIAKEMDQVSRTHDLTILELIFHLMQNICDVIECRVIICKCNLLQHLSRLHPAITKRQKPWESIELLWLNFLEKFTTYPEGQAHVAKFPDTLELIITFANGGKSINRLNAMYVLRNVSFYPSNRSRLLTSDEFINILQLKISNGTYEEINLVVLMLWALIANNQKSKLAIKSAGIDVKLQDQLKLLSLSKGNDEINDVDLGRMRYVLTLLRDGDKLIN